MRKQVVFATPWFDLVAKYPDGTDSPHYSIATKDYVSVVAVTTEGRLLLVRQFRAAVEDDTLELPSGHVEPGDTPEQAARNELLEETGHVAPEFELLGDLSPDTGRLANRLWCFFAGGATPTGDVAHAPEPGIESVLYDRSVAELLMEPRFCSALNTAALFLAVARGRITLGTDQPL